MGSSLSWSAPAWVFSTGCQENLLQCGLSMGCGSLRKYPPALAWESSKGCSVGVCSTVVFSMGCWRISTLVPEVSLAPPPFLTLVFTGLVGVGFFVLFFWWVILVLVVCFFF